MSQSTHHQPHTSNTPKNHSCISLKTELNCPICNQFANSSIDRIIDHMMTKHKLANRLKECIPHSITNPNSITCNECHMQFPETDFYVHIFYQHREKFLNLIALSKYSKSIEKIKIFLDQINEPQLSNSLPEKETKGSLLQVNNKNYIDNDFLAPNKKNQLKKILKNKDKILFADIVNILSIERWDVPRIKFLTEMETQTEHYDLNRQNNENHQNIHTQNNLQNNFSNNLSGNPPNSFPNNFPNNLHNNPPNSFPNNFSDNVSNNLPNSIPNNYPNNLPNNSQPNINNNYRQEFNQNTNQNTFQAYNPNLNTNQNFARGFNFSQNNMNFTPNFNQPFASPFNQDFGQGFNFHTNFSQNSFPQPYNQNAYPNYQWNPNPQINQMNPNVFPNPQMNINNEFNQPHQINQNINQNMDEYQIPNQYFNQDPIINQNHTINQNQNINQNQTINQDDEEISDDFTHDFDDIPPNNKNNNEIEFTEPDNKIFDIYENGYNEGDDDEYNENDDDDDDDDDDYLSFIATTIKTSNLRLNNGKVIAESKVTKKQPKKAIDNSKTIVEEKKFFKELEHLYDNLYLQQKIICTENNIYCNICQLKFNDDIDLFSHILTFHQDELLLDF
ncbi:hypothetical protein TRFO_17484 [Tritrichomonas foetus]|uniref:C2H2-type domain-containing protein n=1 Tax=Tritrichomonas foetus TaxID=1144522 RepID=A0A1J4KP05_9EUKA|nr:hypothetical protein TRFO_17484 [Tritrichomonas foetus]|eukprot:OHT12656.1 hypothetical protein TRFO_17484 [Tritrichomonas foetus]